MAVFRFAVALALLSLRAATASRVVFSLQVTFMVLNNLTFFVFWWLLLDRVPSVRGWSLDDVEALFGVAATSVGLVQVAAGGVRWLGRTIESGALDSLLVQPKPVLLYVAGMRSQASGIGDILSGLAFLGLSGYVTWTTLPLAVAVVCASAVVVLATGVIFFSLGFWWQRSEGLARQLGDVLLTFSLYPDSVFGGVIRVALFTILPAGFVTYVPVRAIRNASWPDAAAALAAAGVFLALALAIFNRGLRRYASGSRFSAVG